MSLLTYQIIQNPQERQILKIPLNTLLQTFPFELWEHIFSYFNRQFVIGEYSENYEGYKKMTTNEFDGLKQTFIEYYNQTHGLYSLIDIENGSHWLQVDSQYLKINWKYAKITSNTINNFYEFREYKTDFIISFINNTKFSKHKANYNLKYELFVSIYLNP